MFGAGSDKGISVAKTTITKQLRYATDNTTITKTNNSNMREEMHVKGILFCLSHIIQFRDLFSYFLSLALVWPH